MDEDGMLSPEEFAERVGVAANTIHRVLRADQEREEDQRRIPGAYKIGTKYRGQWRIPPEAADHWQKWERK
jgi:DeoR/GlpR family transcriptional regulator of sugar metabolism